MTGLMARLRAGRQRHHLRDQFVLLAEFEPGRRHYAYDLCRESGMRPGRVYPALTRLEQAGEITSGWDDGPYPRRRHYQLAERADS